MRSLMAMVGFTVLGGLAGVGSVFYTRSVLARLTAQQEQAGGGEHSAPQRFSAGLTVGMPVAVAACFAGLAASLPNLALLPLYGFLTMICAVLFVVDLRIRRLPDMVVLRAYPLVMLMLAWTGLLSGSWPVVRALLSAGLWVAVFGVPWYLTAGRGMGFGDVKFAPMLGLALGWLGWGASVVGLFAGFAIGGMVGAGGMAARRVKRGTTVPYGPFMIVGAAVGVFAGQPLWDAYLRWMGIA